MIFSLKTHSIERSEAGVFTSWFLNVVDTDVNITFAFINLREHSFFRNLPNLHHLGAPALSYRSGFERVLFCCTCTHTIRITPIPLTTSTITLLRAELSPIRARSFKCVRPIRHLMKFANMLRYIHSLRVICPIPAFAFEEIGKASLSRRQLPYGSSNGSFRSRLLGLT